MARTLRIRKLEIVAHGDVLENDQIVGEFISEKFAIFPGTKHWPSDLVKDIQQNASPRLDAPKNA